MNELAKTIDIYLDAWIEPDEDRRADLIRQAWKPDGRLVDPPLTGEGHARISQMAAALQSNFPGHAFRRVSGIDEHHGQFRFAWELVAPDGTVAMAGLDVGEVAEDGRLVKIAGFIGPLPALAGAPPKAGVDAI